LPRGRPRPRASWTLICLGLVVSVSATALIGVIGGTVWLVAELLAESSNETDDAFWLVVTQAILLAVTRRLTRGMVALWLAETAPEADEVDRWLAESGATPDAA
jgi:hypothetical protein